MTFTSHVRTFNGIELYAAGFGLDVDFVENKRDVKYFETLEEALEEARSAQEQFDAITEVWATEVEK